MKIKIYFAGPLFTTYQRQFIEKCALKLRDEGFEVFVPHEEFSIKNDDSVGDKIEVSNRQRAINVFEKDYEGVSWANVLIVMLDGAQVDDGTASEIGIFTEQMLNDINQEKLNIFGLSSDMRVGPNAEGGESKVLNYFTVGAIYKVGGKIYNNIQNIILELKKLT